MASLGQSVIDLHADLVHKYHRHAGAIDRIWRSLNYAQRSACMKAGAANGEVLRHPLDFKLGNVYKFIPEWNLRDITKAGSDFFLDLLRFRATTQLWYQYSTGLSNGPGDHAYIVETMEKRNLRLAQEYKNCFTVFLPQEGEYGKSYKILSKDSGLMRGLKPAIDAGLCVSQNTGDLILLRQQYLLQCLNIMIEDILKAGSTARGLKAPAKSKKPDTAVSDALSKLQMQDGKKKAKSQLSLTDLVATAQNQKDVLDENLSFLSTAPVVLTYSVKHFFFSRPELVPDEKGRRLPVHTDKYISGAVFETLHMAVQDVVAWDYLTRLLLLLETNTSDKVYRPIILQEISNVCHHEYSRAQAMFKRMLQTDMGSKWFKRTSNVYDKAGNARVTMKGKPEDLTATDPLLHYMLRLVHPDTTAAKAAEWLTRLGDLMESHPDERARISNKEGDALFNLAVIVGFIQDLAPAISIPSLSRKKGQMFVSRFGELEAELNALKDQVDLREFAVPIDNLLEPGMAEEALRSLDKFIVGKVGTKIGFLYQGTLADCLEDLERQYQQVKEKMEKK